MKNKKYRNKLGCELSYWKSGISLRVFRISPNLTSTTTLHKNIFILSRCQTVWTMWTLANDKPVIPSVTFISWAMIIPFWIIGSLYPTCVTDRFINLSVKHTLSLHFDRILLFHWFPTNLNIPLKASDTFLEATAPVKLTIWHCLFINKPFISIYQGISRMFSLPCILHYISRITISEYSKAA